MSGTVNISRGIWHDVAFKDEPFSEREAFMWIIMEASYKPRQKRVGSVTVDLNRGQLVTSVRFMCFAWSWSKSRVDRYLKRLENRDMIGTDSGSGINVITVCKYNDYQNVPNGSGTPKSEKRDSSGTAAGQQRDKPNKGLIPDEIPDAIQESTNVLLSDAPAPIDETAKAISAYNEVAAKHGWSTVQKVTAARRAAVKGRLKDAGGIDGWSIALEKAEASPFLRGERGGFKCSFDFLSKQANFVKLMEGNYDERPSTNNGTSGGNGSKAFGNSIASAVARRRAEQ